MKRQIALLFSLLIVTSLFLNGEQLKELCGFKVEKAGEKLQVTIEIKGEVEITSPFLKNSSRLIVELRNLEKITAPSPLLINNHDLKSISVKVVDSRITQVIFNFETEVPHFTHNALMGNLVISFGSEDSWQKKEEAVVMEALHPLQVQSSVSRKSSIPGDVSPGRIVIGLSSGISHIQDDVFQELYGRSIIFFRGEYAVLLPVPVRYLDLWMGISYGEKSGLSSYLQDSIKFRMWNFSYALRFLKPVSILTPYFGPGLDLVIYREYYPEEFLIPSTSGRDIGFHLQGGTYLRVLPSLSAHLRVKYNFLKTTSNAFEVDLGGLELGAGLIFHFGR